MVPPTIIIKKSLKGAEILNVLQKYDEFYVDMFGGTNGPKGLSLRPLVMNKEATEFKCIKELYKVSLCSLGIWNNKGFGVFQFSKSFVIVVVMIVYVL